MAHKKLTIDDAEERHPDMISGQKWIDSQSKYWYRCPVHGAYLQGFRAHSVGKFKCRACAHENTGFLKRSQYPNAPFTFKCGHFVELPSEGISIKGARWNRHQQGWNCTLCCRIRTDLERTGVGPRGILGRLIYLFRSNKSTSKTHGYKGVDKNPKELLKAWIEQDGKCAWTGEPIELIRNKAVLEHNHETGEFRGFVIPHANRVEGAMGQLTFEGRVKLLSLVYPAEVQAAVELIKKNLDKKTEKD